MKKLFLLFGFLCLSIFVNANVIQNKAESKTENLLSIKNSEFDGCTVTVTIYWYDEYGNYIGYSTGTSTYESSSSTGWNCAFAEHAATQIAQTAPMNCP